MLITKIAILVTTFLGIMACPILSQAQESYPPVYIIQLNDDSINPVTAEYISKGIHKAQENQAACLIIKLDTPGGLLNSTRFIVKEILAATIPIVVYISPSGSRAGSAGVFISYAAHIAVMAPSTNIGAAHPVQMGGGKGKKQDLWDGLRDMLEKNKSVDQTKEDEKSKNNPAPKQNISKDEAADQIVPDDDPMGSKILQDTTAFVRALASQRGRNAEWAVKSVVESSSITDREALELGVIDFIAENQQDMLNQLDGREVKVHEKIVIMRTKDSRIVHVPMDARQRFFNILANPNIAYILMLLGFYGLLYEVTHPGIGVPGIMGAIFLILAFFSMQTLPTNYAALALLILGLFLFIAEAAAPGLGLLSLGGLICLVLGSLLLFDFDSPDMGVSFSVIAGVAIPLAAISVFLVRLAFTAHGRKKLGGEDGIIGECGHAITDITSDKSGKVFVHGERWNAESQSTIKENDKIVVTKVSGMTLTVKKKSKGV